MAQFINSKETIVLQALEGLIAASGGALARLDGYPFIRVVVRSDWDKSRVAVISGGDSGIGRAVAYAFASKGADICIPYLNEHRDAKETVRAVRWRPLGGVPSR